MDPRAVLDGGRILQEKFIAHRVDHLPDVSDRPVIPPEKIRFWMMDDVPNPHRKGNLPTLTHTST